nr:hypothetical protein [Tanacetum cinerariifolium]
MRRFKHGYYNKNKWLILILILPSLYNVERFPFTTKESSTSLRDIIISELPSCIAITPVLSIKEPVKSLIMKDEHLDTILATESDQVIKSSVKDLVPIPSESEGIPNNMCDVPFHDNSSPLDISKDQFEDFSDSNDHGYYNKNKWLILILILPSLYNVRRFPFTTKESSTPLRDIIISELPSCIAITPVLSIEEPVNSLIMKDEHLDTILATESDQVIKSSVKDLVPILSESEGIPDNMCDVPFHDNSSPLDISKDQFDDFSDSNDDSTLIDDGYFSIDDIDYVEASPLDSELVSLKEVKDFDPKDGEIDTDILLTIKDDILHEKLLNINLLIAKIKALKDNLTPST